MNQRAKVLSRLKTMCAVAMFCALAYVCTYLKIPVMFLSLEVKDSIIVLCTLIFGPLWGLVIALVVPTLELLTHSGTGLYGWVMNILSSVTFAMVTGMIYKFKKSFKGAIIGLICGVFSVTAVMVAANLVVTPFYMGVALSEVAALIPKVLLPFNLVKAILNGAIVLLLYKPLSRILKKTGFKRDGPVSAPLGKVEVGDRVSSSAPKGSGSRSLLVSLIAVAVIAASLAIIFFVLK